MSKQHGINSKSRASEFISRRLYELRGNRSQQEIASAAGFQSPNMLSMIKDGKAKLPIERAPALAKALECDAGTLVRLALEDSLSATVLDEIFGSPTEHEVALMSAVALGVEVRAAQHDLRYARQFLSHVLVRMEKIDQRLDRTRQGLDDMIKLTPTPHATGPAR